MGRRQLPRQARSALLWGLAGFVALQGALAVGIEFWLPGLRDPEYGYKMSRLWARLRGSPGLTVMMLGSSRTQLGFRPDRLGTPLAREAARPVTAFNFGVTGAGPFAELMHLRRLLAQGVRPDLLLVEVLPPLLDGRQHGEFERYPAHRLWLRDLPLAERYGGGGLGADWWLTNLLPSFAHRYAIVSRLLPRLLTDALRQNWSRGMDEWGWLSMALREGAGPEQRCADTAAARTEYADRLADLRPGGPPAEALRETLEVCRAEGIPTALVLMPEGSEFRRLYPPEALDATARFLGELQQQYGVPLIDAREWVGDDGFWDSHHLLPAGAAAFTDRLGREAIAPLLRAAGGTGR
jgi:hypothetical protein